MRPEYCNTFNVTREKRRSPVTLSFAHIYTDHSFSVKGGTLTDVSGKVADEVAGVLLELEDFIALTQMVNRMVSDWDIEPEDPDPDDR